MTRAAPKCKTCGNHPRSALHRDMCGIKPKVDKKAPVDPKEYMEAWVAGKTCIQCRTIYNFTPMPEFQDPDAKHGKYDVLKQLPKTASDYPLCTTCLAWAWRLAAKRFGMEKQVQEVYGGGTFDYSANWRTGIG